MSERIQSLAERLTTEADLCRNEGADDIAALLDEAAEALNAFDHPRGLSIAQEPKYTVSDSAIVNRASGLPIPDEEPVFIIRAKDYHARDTIIFYLGKILRNGSANHASAVLARYRDFERFADRHSDRMGHPDTVRASMRSTIPPEEMAAAVDKMLGLVELPPIRIDREMYELIEASASEVGLIVQAYVRGLLKDSLANLRTLVAARAALRAYHHALDTRQHGGVAANALVAALERALDAPWKQGATLTEGGV